MTKLERAKHRFNHPAYKEEKRLLSGMGILTVLAAALMFTAPSFFTGLVFGFGLGQFLLWLYAIFFK